MDERLPSNETDFEDTQVVRDCNGKLLKVGTLVKFDDFEDEHSKAKIVGITEWNADYDDDLQRGVVYCPKITVECLECSDTDTWTTYQLGRGSWKDYNTPEFQCDDMEVIDG